MTNKIKSDITSQQTYKNLRIKSYIGLCIFFISIVVLYFYMSNAWLGLTSIITLLIGWFIFSKHHSEIASLQIKEITQQYINEKLHK